MNTELNLLKNKIDIFKSKFSSKDYPFKYEENKFDKFIGIVFSNIVESLKPFFKYSFKLIMKITDKILNIITQQENLKNKILEQEKILINNIKLNEKLSNQIIQLNDKIDNMALKNLNVNHEESKNNIIENKNINENTFVENKKLNFMQDENLRISNELFESKKKLEILKQEVEKYNKQRTDLINKINSVNEIVNDSNVVTSVFDNNLEKQKIKVLDPEKPIINKPDIEEEIKNIFSKKSV